MKIWIYIPSIILSLFLAAPVHATINVLGSASQGGGNVSTITFTATMPSGTNTAMCAILHLELGASPTADPTWMGTETFTLANAVDSGGADDTEIWCLVGPTSGTHDFVVPLSTSNNHMVGLIFLEGVNTVDLVGATPAGVSGTGLTDSVTITTTMANSLILDGASWGDRDVTLTPGGSQTKQYQVSGTGGGPSNSKVTGSASTRIVTTAQQYINTYTSTDSFNYSYLGIEIKAMVDAGGVHANLVTGGVHDDLVTAGSHNNEVGP